MNQPTTTTTPVVSRGSGFGVAALVLGIIGVVFCWVPVLGLLLGLLALIFGIVGYARARGGMSIAGAVLGGITVVIGIVVIAALGSAAESVSKELGGPPAVPALPTNNAERDVTITKCGDADQFGMNTVTVRVTNSTDRTQSYLVTASLNDAAGNRLAEANGASNSVAPGQSANAELLASGAKGVSQCTIANVTRIPQ
jgi:hypothetical protein